MSVKRRNHSGDAPPELTGGAGFNFEDQVAAHFLVSLLTQERLLFPANRHRIEVVHWQVKDQGWLLDDLLLSLREGPDTAFLALSVKRNRMVTQQGFRTDFVRTAWRQWLGMDTDAFDPDQDLLGLAVGQLAESVKNAWDDLLNYALAGNADRVTRRLSKGSNAIARALFKSLHCPDDLLAEGQPLPSETVRFLSRIRLWGFDFSSPNSRDARDRLKLCQSALAGEDPAQAADLWFRLQNLAFERRPRGGDINSAGLLGELRTHCRLVQAPDYREDWRKLDRLSAEARSSVSAVLGEPRGEGPAVARPSLTLLRHQAYQQLFDCIRRNRVTWLVGSGGAGKSALESVLGHRWRGGTILWLNAGTVRNHSLLTLETELRLRHPIDRLLQEAPGQRSLLILDGLERWQAEALETAARLLAICSQLDHWRILVAIRPDHYRPLRRQLTNLGAPEANAEVVSLEPLSDVELRDICNVFPWIGRLVRRPDLVPFLRNLQVLQSVLSAFPGGKRDNASSWVAGSDVIDELWSRWTGVGEDRHTRSGVLKRLASLEAQSMRGSAGMSELESTEHPVVVALENLEVLRVDEDRVSFVHELIGDWARLRILVEAGEEQLELRLVECAGKPIWSEAIRRFGERLLDRGDEGKRRWRALLDALPRHQDLGAVTRDLLLDSLVFSSSSLAHLEQVWAYLSEDRGALLKRLLQRFLFIATFPSPDVAEIADSEDEVLSVRAYWRIPFVYLWRPMLRVLAGHREDVADFASELAAQLSTLYLSSVPASFPGRREASQLAAALGRRARRLNAQVRGRRDTEAQSAFAAALHAAPDFPEEIAALALEMAQRIPDLPLAERPDVKPNGRKQEANTERTRTATAFSRRLGPLRVPYADGPLARVDESFRAAVLDTQGLTGLMRANPIAAREVLLACCLEEPRPVRVDRDDGIRELGTSTWWTAIARIPIYFQGPFLSFLRIDPVQGLEAILRLVNQVTSNWAESAGDQVEIVRLQLGEDLTVEWLGDQSVYGWYRNSNAPGKVVPTALMALEEWLYNHVDQGEDISRIVQTILRRSRSVAFGGVLAAVAKKKPELFEDPLLHPLLTAWQIYWWDDRLADYDSPWMIDLMDWHSAGERIFNVVRDWHTFSHRKQSLLNIGIQLLLSNQEIQDLFVQIRQFWLRQLQQGQARFEDDLERMIARFDPANYDYRLRTDGALEVSDFQWPGALRERSERATRIYEPGIIASAFPWRCRQRLTSGEPLSREEAEAVCRQTQQMARHIKEEAELPWLDRWADAMAAGILLLLRLAEDWLEQNPEHSAWCRQQLAVLLDRPRAVHAMDHTKYFLDRRWPGFVSEASILLLAKERSDARSRRLVARTIVLGSSGMIAVAFERSFKERQRLGIDWDRLQNLAILWSALHWIAIPWDPSHALLNSWARRLSEWFIQAKLPPEPVDWERVAGIALRLRERLHRREKTLHRDDEFSSQSFRPVLPEDFGLDLYVLKATFAWLPLLKEVRDEHERQSWLRLHRQLLAVATRRRRRIQESQELNPDYEGWLSGLLGDYERWILTRVAALIPQLENPEERRSFWINVLDPSVAAPDHARVLLGAWFTEGRQAAGDARHFVLCWGELIQYVLDFRAGWQPGDDVLCLDDTELMGLLWGAQEVGKEEYQQLLGRLLPLYEIWAASALDDPRSAKLFARFLARPGAKEILRPGLQWLHEALPQLRSAEHSEEGLDDALSSALGVCWRYSEADIRDRDPLLKRAFLDLLAWVSSRNHPAALELRDSARA